jgi:hypothetical protein|tara:strand:- start:3062 stop:3247 length:186 start_codon:yes stop_codon:yes gene_type:complete
MRNLTELSFRLPAIWKTKDYDIPVTIIKYLGQKNGFDWFLVESSEGEQTGVSAEDLFIFEK